MDDLDALRTVGARLDPEGGSPPADDFGRLVATARFRTRRRNTALAGLTAAVVAIAAVSAVGALRGPGRPALPPYNLAADVLTGAAGAVDRHGDPRPDQYIFIETRSTTPDAPAGGTLARSWLSVDGQHDGLAGLPRPVPGLTQIPMPGCRAGQRATIGADGTVDTTRTIACTPTPAYDMSLPTETADMFQYLYSAEISVYPDGSSADEKAFANALTLLSRGYLPSDTQTALYEALARIPGLTVADDVTDGSGRPAIAVTRPGSGSTDRLFIDPISHQMTGWQIMVPMGSTGTDEVTSVALVRVAIVDRVGQVP